MDLDGVVGRTHRRLGREELRLRRGRAVGLAAVDEVGAPPHEQPGRIGVDRHVGDHVLHQLERRDRLAELRTPDGVVDRRLEASLDDADAAGRDREATLVEGAHGDLEAVPDLAEPGRVRDAYLVEEQLGGRLAAQPELAGDLTRLEARGVGRDEEGGHAARTVVAGAREDEGHVGPGAVGDEELAAGDRPVRRLS